MVKMSFLCRDRTQELLTNKEEVEAKIENLIDDIAERGGSDSIRRRIEAHEKEKTELEEMIQKAQERIAPYSSWRERNASRPSVDSGLRQPAMTAARASGDRITPNISRAQTW